MIIIITNAWLDFKKYGGTNEKSFEIDNISISLK